MHLSQTPVAPATSLVLFHCRFADYGLRDHAECKFELQTYLALPHLYAVCAIDDTSRPERMLSGLLVKTNLRYENPGFLDGMTAAFMAVPQLRQGLHEHVSLLPAPVDAGSPRPLTASQAIVVFQQLWAGHLAGQLPARFR